MFTELLGFSYDLLKQCLSSDGSVLFVLESFKLVLDPGVEHNPQLIIMEQKKFAPAG